MTTGTPEPYVFDDPEEVFLKAARHLRNEVVAHDPRIGPFRLALSGGRTPRPLFDLLATDPDVALPWERVHVFFVDERCVPPDDVESNYGMIRRLLLDRLPVRPASVVRIRGEADDPAAAARDYEGAIRADLGAGGGAFDLLLLGLGPDGHTASLFPGALSLAEAEHWAIPVEAPVDVTPRRRITLTLPLLNQAREAWFLVTGADKGDVVARILSGDGPELPAARIHPADGPARWFVDEAAFARYRERMEGRG